jgi:hypothetical protein
LAHIDSPFAYAAWPSRNIAEATRWFAEDNASTAPAAAAV